MNLTSLVIHIVLIWGVLFLRPNLEIACDLGLWLMDANGASVAKPCEA